MFCFVVSVYAPQVLALPSASVTEASVDSDADNPVNDISDFYSDIDMRMRLATKPNGVVCSGDVCLSNQVFDAQVQAIGQSLANSAYEIYPELKKKTPKFEFSVADKKDLGSASNGSGKVVIFRGVQNLDLGDEALSFLVAREMGHVIGRHHKSNAKTKLLFTVLTGVLFPAVSILSASSAAAQVSTATTLLTSAASTATSFLGSEVAIARIKPTQLSEADDISLGLMEDKGLTKADLSQSLAFIVENENPSAWEKDLYQSIQYVQNRAGEPVETIAKLDPLSEDAPIITPLEASIDGLDQPVPNNEKPTAHLAAIDKVKLEEHRLVAPKSEIIKPAETKLPEQKPVGAKFPEPKPIEPKSIELKPAEAKNAKKPKVILITNETLAASHSKAIKSTDATEHKSKIVKSNKNLASNNKMSKKLAAKSASVKKHDAVKTQVKASTKNTKKSYSKNQSKKT